MKRKLLIMLAAFTSHAEALVCNVVIDQALTQTSKQYCYISTHITNQSETLVMVQTLDNEQFLLFPNENLYVNKPFVVDYLDDRPYKVSRQGDTLITTEINGKEKIMHEHIVPINYSELVEYRVKEKPELIDTDITCN